MKAPELNTNQMMTIAYFIGILLVLFIVYKILNGLGLVKTAADKETAAAAQAAVSTLTVDQFFQPDSSVTVLPDDTAAADVKSLQTALGAIFADQETVNVVLGGLPSKTAIKQLAALYHDNYSWFTDSLFVTDNLQADILRRLSATKVKALMDIITNLPD
jgi:hypothetical protein